MIFLPPRRTLYRPPGRPRLVPQRQPRGLAACFVAGDSALWDLVKGRQATLYQPSGNPTYSPTPAGVGFAYQQGNVAIATGEQPTHCSLEALIWTANTSPAGVTTTSTTGTIISFNQGTSPSTTYDRALGLNASKPQFYIYDGAQKRATSGVAIGNSQIHHLVGTADGTNIRIYVDGVLQATTAAGNPFTSYSPPDFCMGGALNNPDVMSAFLGTCLLGLYANVTWTDQEVMARYLDPFSFLEWPEDYMAQVIKGTVAAVSGAKQTAVTVISG